MGSIRSPLWRHGGTVHGPQPRSYAYRLPRKMALGALRSALTAKLRDGELKVVNAFELANHKTKNMREALNKLEGTKSVLLVEVGENNKLNLASRNLPGVKLVPTKDVNVYDLLAHNLILLKRDARPRTLSGKGRWRNELLRRDSSGPSSPKKPSTKKDAERTLCFEVHPEANKIEISPPSRQCSK